MVPRQRTTPNRLVTKGLCQALVSARPAGVNPGQYRLDDGRWRIHRQDRGLLAGRRFLARWYAESLACLKRCLGSKRLRS